MTYLVTGGAGFIGANFVYYMLEKHPADRIVCVDKLTYAGNLSTLADALKQIRELQRMLGKKTMENELLKEAVEYGRQK